MRSLSNIGRIFYGVAIAGLGFQAIYHRDFPYMLIPPKHTWITGIAILAYITGSLLILAGLCIVFEKKTRTIALLLGFALLLIFCFYYIPYQFIATSNYKHLVQWDNALKELALASGAFVIAGCYSKNNEPSFIRLLAKLIPFGSILFSITLICFGTLHFLYAKGVASYIPSYISNHLFWTYVAGAALMGSGIAILFKINPRVIATLLGTMIFIWFIILHIPKAIDSPFAHRGSEMTSAFLALAYSGIAFVIASVSKNKGVVRDRA